MSFPLRDYQDAALHQISLRYADGCSRQLVVMPTGCVSGATVIGLNRAGKGYSSTIRKAFNQQLHGGQDPNIPTKVRAFDGGVIGLHRTNGISYSGVRDTVIVSLVDGKQLTCTNDHLVLTTEGYIPAGSLTREHLVLCQNSTKGQRSPRWRGPYRVVQGLVNHPHAGLTYSTRTNRKPEGILYRVPLHRLVVEAGLNGLSLPEFLRCLRGDATRSLGLTFIDPRKFHVHHMDRNPANNAPANLQLLPRLDHYQEHGDYSRFRISQVAEVAVRSVVPGPRVPTYDVLCVEQHSNFVANGMIVHNSGKTVIFSCLQQFVPIMPGRQRWFLAHRDELIAQMAGTLQRLNPDLKVGVEKERFQHDADCDLVVGSVQTLGVIGRRHERIDVARVDGVTADEAHHFTSPMFKGVLRFFRVLKGDPTEDRSKLLLGVTATPNRSDNIGLEELFDEIVYSKDIRAMIREGWLAKIIAHQISTSVDLTGISVRRGDFVTRQLERAVNVEQRNKLIVDKYLELGENEPGIAFAVDVRHSHDLAIVFRKHGINAQPASGQTPEAERKRLLKAHQSGEVKVLVSCGIYNEGVDLPWASIGMLARPTASGLLLRQMIGRLLRLYPAPEDGPPIKTRAKILDFVDNTSRHSVCQLASLVGLPAKMKLNGESLTVIADAVDAIKEKSKVALPDFSSLAELRTTVRLIDLLGAPSAPPELEGLSKLLWIKTHTGYELVLPEYILSIRETGLGQYVVMRRVRGVESYMASHSKLEGAIVFAESLVPPQERVLVSKTVKWRSLEATEKQIKKLAKIERELVHKFPGYTEFQDFIRANYNRGDVSNIIDRKVAQNRP